MRTHFEGEPYPVGRDQGYFEIRETWVDWRGKFEFSSTAELGFEVMIITASHTPNASPVEGWMGPLTRRIVRVDDHAWIASRAILFDCHVMHHATVGAGAVIQGVVIPPYMMAQGNPAMLVAKWVEGEWERLTMPEMPPPFTERPSDT